MGEKYKGAAEKQSESFGQRNETLAKQANSRVKTAFQKGYIDAKQSGYVTRDIVYLSRMKTASATKGLLVLSALLDDIVAKGGVDKVQKVSNDTKKFMAVALGAPAAVVAAPVTAGVGALGMLNACGVSPVLVYDVKAEVITDSTGKVEFTQQLAKSLGKNKLTLSVDASHFSNGKMSYNPTQIWIGPFFMENIKATNRFNITNSLTVTLDDSTPNSVVMMQKEFGTGDDKVTFAIIADKRVLNFMKNNPQYDILISNEFNLKKVTKLKDPTLNGQARFHQGGSTKLDVSFKTKNRNQNTSGKKSVLKHVKKW